MAISGIALDHFRLVFFMRLYRKLNVTSFQILLDKENRRLLSYLCIA
jgi:hypothetical protein